MLIQMGAVQTYVSVAALIFSIFQISKTSQTSFEELNDLANEDTWPGLRSERGLFRSRSKSRSSSYSPPPYHSPPPPPPPQPTHPPPMYQHPHRPPPPYAAGRPRSRGRGVAGALVPMAAGAAAGYLATSLILKQMKRNNPCALSGVGLSETGQMDSKMAADQRCAAAFTKYQSYFNRNTRGASTGVGAGNAVQPMQQATGNGSGASDAGAARGKRAPQYTAPGNGGTGTNNYNNNNNSNGVANGPNQVPATSRCAGATSASCQDFDGHLKCMVQTPTGAVPIFDCA